MNVLFTAAAFMAERLDEAETELEDLRQENQRLVMLAASLHAGADELPEWARLRVAAMVKG